ncbi:GGDEF domain-containing protein [Marinomonas ostreistagni]|uniref:GGDEF domain-containing protein n=1 Tax=Marinomonas ostreistagni TaxID=359209 RepID=UPI0018F240AE|nr:GGDEF domain-containing protein [Marinomonas ostreistagni]
MHFLKHYIKKLALLSSINAVDVDLNRKQVVNITYLLSSVVGVISGLVFLSYGWLIESSVHFLGAAVSTTGYFLSIKGYAGSARLLFPFACSTYVTVCSFKFYGTDSHFSWLLIVLSAYSVTGFRVDRGKAQLLVCFFSLLAFAFIQLFAPKTTEYVSIDGRLLIALATFVASASMIVLIAGVVVTKLRKLNEHLRYLAEVDDLTKVYNRRKVLAEAVNVFADAIMTNQRCSFAILDLDHFKRINDQYGHDIGDQVLQRCAEIMSNNIRRHDWVGRYGGEEFVFILPNTRAEEAKSLMESVRIQISDMTIFLRDTDERIHVTTSVGVAEIQDDTVRYEQILARADKALYMAKDAGRNRVMLDFDGAR